MFILVREFQRQHTGFIKYIKKRYATEKVGPLIHEGKILMS